MRTLPNTYALGWEAVLCTRRASEVRGSILDWWHAPQPAAVAPGEGTLIQKSAYVLRASGAGAVQTRRRMISHCFEQIAASDDGNLIPTELEEGGDGEGGGGGKRYRGSSRPVAWQRVCLRGATHADTSTRPGRGHPNTPNC
ncbi:hypothetical protein QQF64_008702 [Cirrhinus molitorella]|uniref:Uncharacterized protein n=1 Tax=Cirrhinus molitorella TaxID=172907 RepID=A0ABR3M8A7_9TELE